MPSPDRILFVLGACREYGERLARGCGMSIGRHEEYVFADGEHKIRPAEEVCGRRVAVLQSLHGGPDAGVHDRLCDLLFLIAALKDGLASRIAVLVPYLCYARADRRVHVRDPLTLRHLAELLEAAGADSIASVDVHNPAAFENAFRIASRNVAATDLFVQYFRGLGSEDFEVVSPDIGGVKRAEAFRDALSAALGAPIPAAAIGKRRLDHVGGREEIPAGIRGRTAIIFDDIIATGATLLRAANACRKGGARRVIAAATHGLFLPGSEEILAGSEVDHVIVTDTVPLFRLDPALVERKVTVLDSTRLMGEGVP